MDLSRHKLPGQARIKRRGDFLRLQSTGRKIHGKNFLLIVAPISAQAATTSRIGITVTKKVARLANTRNRLKRRVREIFRALRPTFKSNYDLLVIARSGAPECSYAEIESEVIDALKRGRVL